MKENIEQREINVILRLNPHNYRIKRGIIED